MSRFAPAAVALVVALVYLATAAQWHTPDAAAYADDVLDGQLVHAKHLLHNAYGLAAVRLAQALGYEGAIIEPLQWLNVGGASIGSGLLCWLVARRSGFLAGSLAGLGLAATYGWWSLAGTYEVHIWPAVVVLMALAVATEGEASPARGVVVGLLHGAAILLHQVAALAGPGLALALIGGWGGRRFRALVAYVAVAAALLGAGYGGAARYQSERLGHPVGVEDLLLADVTAGAPSSDRSIGSEVALGWSTTAAARVQRTCLRQRHHPRRVPLPTLGWAYAALGLGLLVRGQRVVRVARREAVAVAAWCWTYVPLVAWKEPLNFEYYLVPTVGLVLLLGLASGPGVLGRLMALLLAGSTALVAVNNLDRDIVPASRTPDDGHHVCADGATSVGRALNAEGLLLAPPPETQLGDAPPATGRHGGPRRGVRGRLDQAP